MGLTIGDKFFLTVYVRLDPKNKPALCRAWRDAHEQTAEESSDRSILTTLRRLLNTIEAQEFLSDERGRAEKALGKVADVAAEGALITVREMQVVDRALLQRYFEVIPQAAGRELAELGRTWEGLRTKLVGTTSETVEDARALAEADLAERQAKEPPVPKPPPVEDVDPVAQWQQEAVALLPADAEAHIGRA